MINFWKWIAKKPANKLIWFIFVWIFFLSACSETDKKEKFIARVNDSFLTERELESKLVDKRYSNKYREELIREWVETEILSQEAESENILEDTLYIQIMNEAEKNLASAFLIRKFFNENTVNISDDEVFQYYNERKEEFRFNSDVYVYNLIKLTDESKAIDFRNTLIETDWSKANNAFLKDSSILYKSSSLLKHDYELNPPVLLKILKYLRDDETSIIFETEPGVFNIVQLIKKISKNEIPEFKYVKKNVAGRVSTLKRHEAYREYLDDLFAKYNVVINGYEE